LQRRNGIRQNREKRGWQLFTSSFSWLLFKRKKDAVRDQLEALILQMYKSNILYSEAVREFKKRFILTVLQENNGNQCRAARQLGMHRNTLSRTITELKIDIRQLRAGVKRPPRSARPTAYDKKAVR
jgi:Fis family transcriptional regulator